MGTARGRSWLAALLATGLLAGLASPTAARAAPGSGIAAPPLAGLPLTDALLRLRARGLRIVFASNVVRPELRVESEPQSTDPRGALAELLAAAGLATREGPGGILIVVPAPAPAPATGVDAASPGAAPESGEPAARFAEELTVTPSRVELLGDEPARGIGLGRDEIAALPHLGDDFFRALTLLAGTAGNDVSAAFHVRGGERDENLIVLDGQELFDAFHLQDYDDALSVVAPSTLDGAELLSGTFPARYGDRMSGVLDLRTATPGGGRRFWLGASIVGAQAGGSGSFPGGRGGWLAELRRGSLDLIGQLRGGEDPGYWDGFGKLDLELAGRHSLRVDLLHAEDDLRFVESEKGAAKRLATAYLGSHAWASLDSLWAANLLVETAAARARVERDRRGSEIEEVGDFGVRDLRDSDVTELRQTWSAVAGAGHELEAGWQGRDFASDLDYAALHRFDDPLALIRHDAGEESTTFAGHLSERHRAAFLQDRWRIAPELSLELGLRYDGYASSDEGHLSPRFNLAWRFAPASVVRLGWGRFDQGERPYEVAIEDGETALHRVERSRQAVVGLETAFEGSGAARITRLRFEVYERRIDDPRPRYENLFEPINTFPELEPDRVRVAPAESRAAGAELSLRGRLGSAGWWGNVTWSRAEDELDGRWVPRPYDQTWAANLGLALELGRRWRLDAAWRLHTGWPTTPLAVGTVVDEEGEVEAVPLLGALRSARLAPFHRLDLRLSRAWIGRRSRLELFFDLQNAYDRANPSGFDYEILVEERRLLATPEHWPGILGSAGIRIEF